jgi:transcriptional regulator with XRE-family HTH domain
MPRPLKNCLKPLDVGNETIGQRLSRFRRERGFTQEQLASVIGINQVLISKYENGSLKISTEMLIRFANILKVSTDSILGIDKKNTKPHETPSLKVLKRVSKISKLPPDKQKAILKTLDMALESTGSRGHVAEKSPSYAAPDA